MRVNQLGIIYDFIEDIFEGDKRPLQLAGVLPISQQNLTYLLLSSGLIDINNNLAITATKEKFVFVISMYYSLRSQLSFTKPDPPGVSAKAPG